MENEFLDFVISNLKAQVKIDEALLKVEESGNKIAFLQGFCSGFKRLEKILNGIITVENVSDCPKNMFYWDSEQKKYHLGEEKLSYSDLVHLNALVYDFIDFYDDKIKKFVDEEIEECKSLLFFNSEKGRDIFFYHGVYQAIIAPIEYANAIIEAYNIETELRKDNLFNEDEE